MKKVLVIEDDSRIGRILQLELEHEGYNVELIPDGEEGLKKFSNGEYDIILLDLMLPKLSGEEVCKQIRKNSQIPIIILTAKDQLTNKVELLDMGADDYLTKPFEIEELLARMRVVFRNKKDYKKGNFLNYRDLKLDLDLKKIYIKEIELSLTKREYALMEYFILNKELVLSREQILTSIWGYDYNGEEKIVDVYINTLRKKLKGDYIQTVRGFGYMLKED